MKASIQNANNVPIHAPLFKDPFVPYSCRDNTTLTVYLKAKREHLERHLSPTPFELAGDIILFYISDFSNCNTVAFMDAGVMLSISYNGKPGGYVLYEYENDDAAMAAGRELWGYPKKFADISLGLEGSRASGRVVRKGRPLFELECDLSQPVDCPPMVTTPHFNVHVQAGHAGGVLRRRVIERDTSPDFRTTSSRNGQARFSCDPTASDPFDLLGPLEVLGANYLVGDFHATEENGWGREIAVLD